MDVTARKAKKKLNRCGTESLETYTEATVAGRYVSKTGPHRNI